jgi:branched-chain amino acid transport system permease protein
MKKIIVYLLALIVAVLLPWSLGPYWLEVLNLALINCISVLGLSIIFGFCGLASFCHATFVGIASYASGILVVKAGLPAWISMILAILLPPIVALGIGYPSLRLHGVYFAIATMCFSVIVSVVVWSWEDLTGGYLGILNVPSFEPARIFKDNRLFYYLILAFLILVYYVLHRLVKSRIGRAMIAIREHEVLASSMGVNVPQYKLLAFMIGTMIAGVGGSLTVHYLHTITPEFINLGQSFTLVMYVVIGGLGSLYGPVAATIIFCFMSEYLRATEMLQMIIYGVVLLLFIMYIPGGLASTFESVVKKIRSLKRAAANEGKIA